MVALTLFALSIAAADTITVRVERTEADGRVKQQALIFSDNGKRVKLTRNTSEFCDLKPPVKIGEFESEDPAAWGLDYRMAKQLALRLDRTKDAPLPRKGDPHGVYYYLNDYWIPERSPEYLFVHELLYTGCLNFK